MGARAHSGATYPLRTDSRSFGVSCGVLGSRVRACARAWRRSSATDIPIEYPRPTVRCRAGVFFFPGEAENEMRVMRTPDRQRRLCPLGPPARQNLAPPPAVARWKVSLSPAHREQEFCGCQSFNPVVGAFFCNSRARARGGPSDLGNALRGRGKYRDLTASPPRMAHLRAYTGNRRVSAGKRTGRGRGRVTPTSDNRSAQAPQTAAR